MKKCLLLCLQSLLLLLTGCVKNEFKVEFNLDGKVTDNYRVSYYAADKSHGWLMESATPVSAGKGSFTGMTRLPVIVFLSGSDDFPLHFFAERGDRIVITGEGNDPLKWRVGGNDINEEWSEWRIANYSALKNPEKRNAAVARYVRSNPDNPLSTLLLLTSYDQNAPGSDFDTLWLSLGEKSRKGEWLQLFNRLDIPTVTLNIPGTNQNGFRILADADSALEVRYADARRTLFWFKERYDNHLTGNEMKELREAFAGQDVAQRRLAVILCVPDSAAPTHESITDSIPTAKVMWAPDGVASRAAASLNVNSVPRFVVTDSKGKTLYNGKNVKEALKKL